MIESLWEMKRGLLRRPFILPVEAVQSFGWRNERWSELSYFENHPQAGTRRSAEILGSFFRVCFSETFCRREEAGLKMRPGKEVPISGW